MLTLATLAFAPLPADAQTQPEEPPAWSLDLWLGLASPRGDLSELNRDGTLGAISLGYALGSRWRARVDAIFVNLERGGTRRRVLGGARGPNTHLWHFLAGAELRLTPPQDDLRVDVSLLGGSTYQDVSEPLGEPRLPDEAGPVEAHVPTLSGELGFGYDFTRRVGIFMRGGVTAMFGDVHDPEGSFLGKEAMLTHTGGVRFRF